MDDGRPRRRLPWFVGLIKRRGEEAILTVWTPRYKKERPSLGSLNPSQVVATNHAVVKALGRHSYKLYLSRSYLHQEGTKTSANLRQLIEQGMCNICSFMFLCPWDAAEPTVVVGHWWHRSWGVGLLIKFDVYYVITWTPWSMRRPSRSFRVPEVRSCLVQLLKSASTAKK